MQLRGGGHDASPSASASRSRRATRSHSHRPHNPPRAISPPWSTSPHRGQPRPLARAHSARCRASASAARPHGPQNVCCVVSVRSPHLAHARPSDGERRSLRCRSDRPPQIPNFSRPSFAASRHSADTGQTAHTCFAGSASSPRPGKNRSGSSPRHAACSRQDTTPRFPAPHRDTHPALTLTRRHVLRLPTPRTRPRRRDTRRTHLLR